MVFDYGKVIISNEREVIFMETKTSTIENIIIEKVETYYIDLLSKLHKDMVAPMMIIRRLVRIYCENNIQHICSKIGFLHIYNADVHII